MKANELMIGDWVRCQYTPFQVEGIEHRNKRYTVTGDGFNTNVAGVHPIPLTAEILNANFPDVRNGVFWCWNDYKSTEQEIWFEIRIEKDTDESLIRNIRYVHELQHALRLCGIKKEVEV